VEISNRKVGSTETGTGKDGVAAYGYSLSQGGGSESTNIFALNNIIQTDGPVVKNEVAYPKMDYDLIYNPMISTYRSVWGEWGGKSYGSPSNTNAQNFGLFRDGTLQERNGIAGQATFIDRANKDFRLATGSLGIDKGVIIQGFNDPDAKWAYRNTSPDIGAFEVGGSVPPPVPTLIPTNTPVPTVIVTSIPTPTRTPTSTPFPPVIATVVPPANTPIPSPTPTPKLIPTPVACAIASASWNSSTNPVTQGTVVTLSATTNNSPLCAGKQVAFEVRENDSLLEGLLDEPVTTNPASASIVGATASSAWTSEWQEDGLLGVFNPPEYFFNASLTDNPSVKTRSSDPLLSVNKASIQVLSRVEIQPASLTTSVGVPPTGMSALAYDMNNKPIWSGVSYSWGISSANSIGTLSPTSSTITNFKPLKAGSGDLFVYASFSNRTVVKSMRVTVNSVLTPTVTPTPTPKPKIRSDVNGNGCVDIIDFSLWLSAFKAGVAVPESNPDINRDGRIDLLDFNEWFITMRTGGNECL
jgi:hypothetical protein